MSSKKRMTRKQAEKYIKHRTQRVRQRAGALMNDHVGTDVLPAAYAAAALKLYYPNVNLMTPNELQWAVNGLLAQVIPDAERKYVHVEGADGVPKFRSIRAPSTIMADVAEIAWFWFDLCKSRSELLGI